ncbi:uncharacterized protein A4U43_C09F14960 [Asparagus officinalis]|uniref:U5 small nuclear ribonucleoprotein TSSC4 n=1 Tax=Asparagus officinalis TaxID=4686 RepID=A0A5P1E9J5_ASPOF|nr:RNA-binding protein 25-like [Asparagus officinalis]ONK58623.1 uncharacterized protein A4U43_C09F14960 [Asparagus officinalis]
MAESFEDRVKRLFGSKLFDAVPKSSFPSSSWSVAVGEVERREWNRDKGEDEDRERDPCSSAFYDKDGCLFKSRRSKRDKQREFEGDLDDFDDDEGGGGGEGEEERERERERTGEGDEEREEREIRSSVGLDPTLDHEEEEDEYDKAALCRENASERVYMRDVKDHGPYINYHAVVPDFLDEQSDEAPYFNKDPRADHFAASVRLKEDKSIEPLSKPAAKITNHDVNVKPILKRKEAQIDPKPKKRVRFDPGYMGDLDELSEEPGDVPMLPRSMAESPGVPDYLRNPSKYTCYTLDSSQNEEETNKQAFEDFRNLVKKSNPEDRQPEFPVDLPKSVTFTPRKKAVDLVPMDDSPVNSKELHQAMDSSVKIAAGETNENDASEMDEDEAEAPLGDTDMSLRKGRKYRSKVTSDDST